MPESNAALELSFDVREDGAGRFVVEAVLPPVVTTELDLSNVWVESEVVDEHGRSKLVRYVPVRKL